MCICMCVEMSICESMPPRTLSRGHRPHCLQLPVDLLFYRVRRCSPTRLLGLHPRRQAQCFPPLSPARTRLGSPPSSPTPADAGSDLSPMEVSSLSPRSPMLATSTAESCPRRTSLVRVCLDISLGRSLRRSCLQMSKHARRST